MAVFKCKMCGGTIEFEQGATIGVCDSCGTKQTLPRLDDDRRANLYDRANHFRRNNEFDKAAAIYEQILTEDTTDAEAYWSLVLCQYGIEYVEDPATHKRVPTVNRAQFTSIFDDDNYKSAIQYADGYQRELYEKEAKTINDIQKGILAISQKEEPFDVFICYKETDNNGRRTPDSVLANDLYYQLKQEGFKVFFARITLEDKLGTAYEPYIFAALNSSKVMVVLGTKPEHFNAVWVKNEWSRYLALVKKSGGKKILIPAYKDMDPYDLPEEFSHLQAQDMSKLGFMQDLIRGIKKVVEKSEPQAAVKETVVVGAVNANIAPLLERAFLFLEDGKWQDANIYCEKVLDIDPKNAEAYLGKLMAELQVRTRKQLADCSEPFDDRENYGKVIRFGDEKLKTEMRGYIAHINERNENARLEKIYSTALGTMNTGDSDADFKAAAEAFKSISGYKDADEQFAVCKQRIDAIKAQEEADLLERKRQAEERLIAAEKAAKRRKKITVIVTPIIVACFAFAIVLTKVIIPSGKYNSAVELYNAGKYDEAITVFKALNGYKDSEAQIMKCEEAIKDGKYNSAVELYNAGKFDKAITAFKALNGYKDSEAQITKCDTAIKDAKYNSAVELCNAGNYDNAIAMFKGLEGYKDSAYKEVECLFLKQKLGLTNVTVGSIIKFGSYEQDNDTSNGKEEIEWKTLAVEGNKALVISKYALDCRMYHNNKYTNTIWDNCTLRTWLNGTFYNTAFGSDHQKRIVIATTTDKVFLLNDNEVREYFSSDNARKCAPTDYAIAQGANTNSAYSKDGRDTCWWWLRSPGYGTHRAGDVTDYGNVSDLGQIVNNSDGAVRPALWINLG